MTRPREARLHFAARPEDAPRTLAAQGVMSLVQQLAAQHGVQLTNDAALLEWLVRADVPIHHPDAPAFAAIAAVVQHLYTLSSPGGDEGVSR